MTQWLGDTNIVGEAMRPQPNTLLSARLKQQEGIFVSAITVEDITLGLQRAAMNKRLEWFEAFVADQITILEVDKDIAYRAGKIRAELSRNGKTREQADMLIAATAWTHGLTLATRNTRDFKGTGIALFNPFEG